MENDYFVGTTEHKIRLNGRRGQGTAELSSREKLRQAPQKEDGEILCDPGWCVLRPQVSVTSEITRMTTYRLSSCFKSCSPSVIIIEYLWLVQSNRRPRSAVLNSGSFVFIFIGEGGERRHFRQHTRFRDFFFFSNDSVKINV